MWKERLEADPLLHARWMHHPTRDEYWKHGSVCEDYSAIKAKVLAVGGWGDAYKNAVSRIVTNVEGAKGIVGPWIHKYPHFALPNPIGFLQEALRWWDRWLKDIDTGVENDPAMRIFVQESERPKPWYDSRTRQLDCREELARARHQAEAVGAEGRPHARRGRGGTVRTRSQLARRYGTSGRRILRHLLGAGTWQATNGATTHLSLTFDGAPLDAPLDIVGAPVLRLRLKADKPVAQIAVRLNDVYRDGASTRITWGVLKSLSQERPRSP